MCQSPLRFETGRAGPPTRMDLTWVGPGQARSGPAPIYRVCPGAEIPANGQAGRAWAEPEKRLIFLAVEGSAGYFVKFFKLRHIELSFIIIQLTS